MKAQQEILTFNRGLISRLALARVDLKRTALSAEIQTNWMPRALGSMMLRPGLGYLAATKSNAKARAIPFIFASDDTARLEITSGSMRILINDAVVSRSAVSSAVTNGTFNADISGWTDADESSAVSAWVAGGYMGLTGTGVDSAIRRQQVAIAGSDAGVEHGLRIVIARGPVKLRVGSSSGGDQYVNETSLSPGAHSIAFTPTGDFHIEFSNATQNVAYVDSVAVESAGAVEIAAPWSEADLSLIRFDQSGDVIFVACAGYQQRRIERRSARSWSVVLYQTVDGPFRTENITGTTITPSDINGNISLVASNSLFRSTHVGALFSITSVGQLVEESFTGDNQFSDMIRVTGVGENRRFAIILSGTFTATVTLQRSADEGASWDDITTYTTATSVTYADGLDNQILHYRLGVKTGNYTSGQADLTMNYEFGSVTGVVRITAVTDQTNASAEVLTSLGGVDATEVWAEGAWSDYRGWPSAIALHEGRLWWVGKDQFRGSITDGFSSFDAEFEGDAGPVSRTIGSGPVDSINWALSLDRLIAGTDGSVVVCRSSAFDEPLTPTNFNVKTPVTQGAARVQAQKIDGQAIFVQQCGSRVYELSFDVKQNNYIPEDLTALVPEIGSPGVVGMAVQRQPDTRIHCWRSDGTVAVLIFDKTENLVCWVNVETDGEVEDVSVLPGTVEDAVYYIVKRTINGATVRYHERWALESEARGGQISKVADSFKLWTGPGSSVTGAGHLEGSSVTVWADGRDIGTKTVSGGGFALGATYTSVVYGLTYEATFKSTKLAYTIEPGWSSLTARKRVNSIGLVLADTHAQGLSFGPDFTTMDDLPGIERAEAVDADHVWEAYDNDVISFPGEWSTDSRLCLKAESPRPCTVLAAIVGLVTNPNG